MDPGEGPAARSDDLTSYPHCLLVATCRCLKAGFLLQERKATPILGQGSSVWVPY